jgi:AraC-like DNA-binding protein
LTFNGSLVQPKENHFSKQVTDARQILFGIPRETHEELSVVSVGCERCLPEFLVDRKTFPQHTSNRENMEFTTFEFVLEGEGKIRLEDKFHELEPGSVFTYSRGVHHRIENSSKKPMLKYFLVCAHHSSEQPFKAVHSGKAGFFHITSIGEVMELFELILSNANLDSEYGVSICNALAKALVLKLCEKAKHFSQTGSMAWNTYNRALQFMRRNYFSLKSIEELANEVNVDPAYLSRIFRRFHKDTPYKFLSRLKMGHAASLLLTTGYLVKNVAFELGFENPFHFSRAFKSVYGISPESFVKERRQEKNLS